VGDSMLASQTGLKPERPTVLDVEDEVLLRRMIAEELRHQGIHVLEASNADEALTILGSSLPVHLLFTDYPDARPDRWYRSRQTRTRPLSATEAHHDIQQPAGWFFARPPTRSVPSPTTCTPWSSRCNSFCRRSSDDR
jgi:CheY-like chemotaxis protein